MSISYIAVSVSDANGAPISGCSIAMVDPGSMLKNPVDLIGSETQTNGTAYQIFDLKNLRKVTISVTHPQYAARTLDVDRDANTDRLSTSARSVYFGIVTPLSSASGRARGLIVQTVEIPLLRVRRAPIRMLPVPGPTGTAEGVVSEPDPGGIWADPSQRIVGLTDGSISAYPVVVDPTLSKDDTKSDWGRFNSTAKSVDPNADTGGTWCDWLEYGDAGSAKWLIFIWVIGRAGAKPNPNTTDVLVFYSPSTMIPVYAPKSVYPYRRKFVLNKRANRYVCVQPYSLLAYKYLSPGARTGADGKDFGLAYQAMAAERSLVFIMPLQFYGFWGPVLAQDGLARLIREVLLYVGDNTQRATLPQSAFGRNESPVLGRIAIAGYSAGMHDVRTLLKTQTYRALADTYAALASKASGANRSNYNDMAQQLRALPESLWASPAEQFTQNCRELYSIDGFFKDDNKAFQNEMADWFTATNDAMLRIYATDGRFKESDVITGTRLTNVFPATPSVKLGTGSLRSMEYHRDDKRASFAWFTESFMTFTGVDFMPDHTDPDIDAHHTIPRVVLAHALSQSRLARP